MCGYMTNSLCSDIRCECQARKIGMGEMVGLGCGLRGQIAELLEPHGGGFDGYVEREGNTLAEH